MKDSEYFSMTTLENSRGNHVSFLYVYKAGNVDSTTLVHITYAFTLLNKQTDYNLSFMTLVDMLERAKSETDREITDETFTTLKLKKQRRRKHTKKLQ